MPILREFENDAPLLLTVGDAARLLAVGRTTLYALIKRGELRTVAIGRARRIPRAALEQFVETSDSAA